MTKFYIPLLAIALAGGSASAQQNRGQIQTDKRVPPAGTSGERGGSRIDHFNRDVIWSDDFSTPGNWVAGTIATYDADTWSIGTDGPDGAFPIPAIESTTAANGFALFDSDLHCGGNQNATLTLTTGVDLSLYNGAMVQFEQFTLRYWGEYYLDVSVDGGASWTEIEFNTDLEFNADVLPDNPLIGQVDISQYVIGEEDVRIRFRYLSTAAMGTPANPGGCDYAWMVDDVSIVTLPENEIHLDYGFISTYTDMAAGGAYEYGQIPASQLPGTMTVGGGIINVGLNTQTNVVLHVAFEDGAGNAVPGFSGSIPVNADILSRDTADVEASINIPSGLTPGIYTAKFTLSGDLVDVDTDPSDNELDRYFAVSTATYALDGLGVHPVGTELLSYLSTYSFSDNSEVYCMNLYNLTTEMTATGIAVEVVGDTYTVPGDDAELEAFIFEDVAAVQSQAGTGLIEGGMVTRAKNGITSGTHYVTAADVTSGVVNLAFEAPLTLAPGAYYAVVRMKGTGTSATPRTDPDIAIYDDRTVPQPGLASAIYVQVDENDDGTEGRHSYGDGNAFAIRLLSSPLSSVQSRSELSGISLYPNPTEGLFQVTSDRTEVLFVEVSDALGKIVHTANFTGTTTIDLSKVAAGVYSVEVSSRNERSMHRISVK